jgi:hypothetical protein
MNEIPLLVCRPSPSSHRRRSSLNFSFTSARQVAFEFEQGHIKYYLACVSSLLQQPPSSHLPETDDDCAHPCFRPKIGEE